MTKKQLVETITDTLNLIQTLQETIDYNVITQLGWNLGWHQNIYTTEILEDPYYDEQALFLTAKILQQILDTQNEKRT